MPSRQVRDPANPILNSPYEEPGLHYATDQSGNLNYDDVRDRQEVRDFMRLQAGSMARMWKESADDNL